MDIPTPVSGRHFPSHPSKNKIHHIFLNVFLKYSAGHTISTLNKKMKTEKLGGMLN
jgi:hypothetical protein